MTSKSDFLKRNRISVRGFFTDVHLTPSKNNTRNNSDEFLITFAPQQSAWIGRKEVKRVSFRVVGPQELCELVELLQTAYDMLMIGAIGRDVSAFDAEEEVDEALFG